MANIFISYSHKDQIYVQKLVAYLKNEGLSVWVDERIEHGDRWWQTIEREIRDCAAMIVIMTPESKNTKWVEREMMFADRIDKPIFPLLLKGECFPFFGNQQYHEVRDGSMPPKKFTASLKRLTFQRNDEAHKQKEADAKRIAEKESKHKEEKTRETFPRTFKNSSGMEFVLIPAGSFMMGSHISTWEAVERYGGFDDFHLDEDPQHEVIIKMPFYLQSTPVTYKHWIKIMKKNPYRWNEAERRDSRKNIAKFFTKRRDERFEKHLRSLNDCPVSYVSWEDVKGFIKKMNEKAGITIYRLPTEAEWEYACRAGSTTQFFFGDDPNKLGEYAWSGFKHSQKPVATKKPNPFGLYDMHGSVWELVEDDWHSSYRGAPTDGSAWIDKERASKYKVKRGGSYRVVALLCRSASRKEIEKSSCLEDVGFRLAAPVPVAP
jgi:formylglycine-generating enzyme required for sulfatase activity